MGRYSIIMPVYNHAQFLPEVMKYVLGQTRPADEIIIVDDASTDGGREWLIKNVSMLPSVRLVLNNVNCGVEATLERGVKEAASEYIYFMSADDVYSLHIFERCDALLDRHPSLVMVSANAGSFHQEEGWKRDYILPFPQDEARVYGRSDLECVAQKMSVTFYGGANLIRRDIFLDLGGFYSQLRWHADWFLYLILALRYPFGVIPDQFMRMRVSESQYSRARYQWDKERVVFEGLFEILQNECAAEYEFFKRGAILPMYPARALLFFLFRKRYCDFLTPLLVWRLLTLNFFRMIGKAISPRLRVRIRTLIRV